MRVGLVLARAVVRTGRVRVGLLVVVLALSLGFGLFAATGARRTSSALDRFIAWSQPPHVETGGSGGDGPVSDHFDEIAALEPVVQTQANLSIGLHGALVHGERIPPMRFAAVAFEGRVNESFDRVLVLRGEVPENPRPDQGIIDFGTAERLDLDIGDTVTLLAATGREGGDTLELPIEVVAVFSSPRSLPTLAGYQFNVIAMGPSFVDEYPELVDPYGVGLGIRLRNGHAGVGALRAAMAEAGLDHIDVVSTESVEVGADRLFALEAAAMWLAAALALSVGLPVAYQLLRRDAAANRSTVDVLFAVGATRVDLVTGAALRGLAIGAVASVVGATGAVAASPLSPVGMARNAEPDSGVWVDWTVIGLGIPLFVFGVSIAASIAMWRTARQQAPAHSPVRASRWLGARVPAPVAVGMGAGGRGLSAAAGIGASVAAAVLVVCLALVAGSLAALPRDAELSGGVWDAWFESQPHAADEVDRLLDETPEVRAHGVGGWFEMQAGSEFLYTITLPRLSGMEPAIVRGRGPRADDEVALGARAMERLGVGIGDRLTAEVPGAGLDPLDLTVTGEMIVAAPLFQSHSPDDAALVAIDLGDVVDMEGHRIELVRFTDGADAEPTMDRIVDQAPENSFTFYFSRGERGDVIALQRLQGLVRAILTMASALAAASLIHYLLVTHRRRRREFAVLRSIGFTSGDISVVGGTLGFTTTALTFLIAVPLGLAVGSVVWHQLSGALVVLPRVTVEVSVVTTGIAVAVISATAIALSLARRPARRPISESLRAE